MSQTVWVLRIKNKHRPTTQVVADVFTTEDAAKEDAKLYPADSWEPVITSHEVKC